MLRSSSSWPDAFSVQQREGRGGLGERGLVSPKYLSSGAAQPLLRTAVPSSRILALVF